MDVQPSGGSSDGAGAPVGGRAAQDANRAQANSTTVFRTRMKRAPLWFCSFLAGNSREKLRLRDELVLIKGAWPLLMKQRNGGKWTPEEKLRLKAIVRSASSVSPYLFIWALPGSVVLLPLLAWYLDRQRRRATRKQPL